jgi:predicted amidophosphoribosyltransferase
MSFGTCWNSLCRDPQRRIARIRAIAYLSGDLQRKIWDYKYKGRTAWATIFGRLLLGWLESHEVDRPPEFIVANPSFRGTNGSGFGHTESVIRAAEREDILGALPFDVSEPRSLVKVRATRQSANGNLQEKMAAAKEHRDAIVVTDRTLFQGRRILLYDDVCTTGHQLDEVARLLLDTYGADHVEALVLARAPWKR